MCLLLVPAFAIEYKDCGSQMSNISKITVSGCEKEPCTFKRGSKVNVSITFVPKVEIKNTTVNVWGLWNLVKVPFPIPNPDGCKNSGLTCPLKPNVSATYHIELDIKIEYPKITLVAKWKMVDEKKRSVFCFEIGVILK